MTLKQFNSQYPEFTGFIFLNGGFFLDSKLKEYLDLLGTKYIELKLDYMDNSFLKMVNPNIGPNLLFFKDSIFITKIDSLTGLDNLREFIENCYKL